MSSTQTPEQVSEPTQGAEGKLKLVSTALPVFAAVSYPIGFVLLNVVYSMWGFTDFQVLRTQCFLVVGWNCLMILAASLPVFLLLSFKGTPWQNLSRGMRILNVSILLVAIALGIVVWIVGSHHFDVIRSWILENSTAICFALIIIPGCIMLIVPVGIVKDNKRVSDVQLQQWAAGGLGIVAATLCFSIAYVFIPASWGGGMPERKTYFVPPPSAVEYLAPFNWQIWLLQTLQNNRKDMFRSSKRLMVSTLSTKVPTA